jgi:hypothetical protein
MIASEIPAATKQYSMAAVTDSFLKMAITFDTGDLCFL